VFVAWLTSLPRRQVDRRQSGGSPWRVAV